jgi:hypothetical protein
MIIHLHKVLGQSNCMQYAFCILEVRRRAAWWWAVQVVRNKNKWKRIMKNGIVHIDGREYVFSKATGEFVF